MSQKHVTLKGFCTYCGAKLTQCIICGDWFIAKNKTHIYCRSRCRTRKFRLSKIKLAINS